MKAANNQHTHRPCATAAQGRFSARLRVLLTALCLWLVEKARVGWRGALMRTAAVLACVLMTSCHGRLSDNECSFSCPAADADFYASTYLELSPGSAVVNPGEAASAQVTLAYDYTLKDGRFARYVLDNLSVVMPAHPGVTLTPTAEPCATKPTLAGQDPSHIQCQVHQLTISGEAVASGTLSAQWTGGDAGAIIERVATFILSLPAGPPPPSFDIAVGTSAERVYVVRGQIPVSIARVGGFAEPVQLTFASLGSGIVGTFTPNPGPGDVAMLQLDIPARYTEGGMVPPRVTGTGSAGGLSRSKDFTQRIEQLFTMALSPGGGTITTAAPLDVLVTITFDELGPIRRTLRLSTDGAESAMGLVEVGATATGLAPDLAGDKPHAARFLSLQVTAGLQDTSTLENPAILEQLAQSN